MRNAKCLGTFYKLCQFNINLFPHTDRLINLLETYDGVTNTIKFYEQKTFESISIFQTMSLIWKWKNAKTNGTWKVSAPKPK